MPTFTEQSRIFSTGSHSIPGKGFELAEKMTQWHTTHHATDGIFSPALLSGLALGETAPQANPAQNTDAWTALISTLTGTGTSTNT